MIRRLLPALTLAWLAGCSTAPSGQDWLGLPGTYALSDSLAALGGPEIAELPNVSAGTRSAGLTFLAKQRLGEIVVENAKRFLTD